MVSMREEFVLTVTKLLDERPEAALVLADIGNDLFAETGAIDRHPDRVINVGIREQLMIGVTAGFALEGFRPIAHSYTPFLVERPFEQIKLDFGHQGVGAVLVSIGASYDAAAAGRTHQAPGDVALIGTLPDWTIYVPGHPGEVGPVLRSAFDRAGSVYVRLSDETNDRPVTEGIDGVAVIKRGGDQAPTVLAVGPALDSVVGACEGRDFTVLYTATIRPLDTEEVRSAVTARDVILVEPYLEGTSAAEMSRILEPAPHRLLCIGVPRSEHRR